MKTLYLNIADCIIKIIFYNSAYYSERFKFIELIERNYAGFINKELTINSDYTIKFIESTQEVSIFNKENNNGYILYYHRVKKYIFETYYFLSVFQFQSILNDIILEYLDNANGFILHASASRVENGAAIFLGKSGSGKSTIMTLLHSKFQSLASDSLIIKKICNNYFVFQTPFIEKDMWVKKKKGKFTIKSIFFLHKATSCHIEKVYDTNFIISSLTKQIILNNYGKSKMIGMLADLISKKPLFYNLYFSKDAKQLTHILKKI